MAKEYRIELAPAAQRQIKKLNSEIKKYIVEHIEKLEKNPRPHGVKKLSGIDELYRVRVKDHRIIYTIYDNILLVLIVKIADRRDVYKNMKKLK